MAANAIGRPSKYTPELASEICERLVNEPLAQICRSEHVPAIGTVLQWVEDNREGFAERYARARSAQVEKMAHDILEIADDSSGDVVTRYNSNGEPYDHVDQENINRARLRVDTRKWLLSRLRPRVYGDATLLKHADANGNALEVQVTRVSPRPPKVIDVTPARARLTPAPLEQDEDPGVPGGTASEGAD